MHQLMGVVLEAEDHEDANGQAVEFIQQLSKAYPIIDYGSVNGIDRKYEDADTYIVTSKLGKALVTRLLTYTKDALFKSLDAVRQGLDVMTNDQFWTKGGHDYDKDSPTFLIGYELHNAGAYGGPGIRLYDESYSGTEGIRSKDHYKNAKKYWNDNYWIVGFDVHY